MKYTIEGFSQAYAMTLRKEVDVKGKIVTRKIDCTDLVILRWFVDFYPNMKKMTVDGREYAWLTHKKLLEDLPLIDINKRSFIDRMQKLVEFGILTYKLEKDGGTFSLYGFGENYANMVSKQSAPVCNQTAQGSTVEPHRVVQSNDIGGCNQPYNKDTSISDSSINDESIKDSNNIYSAVVAHLNEKADTAYRSTTEATRRLIKARLKDGFTEADFYKVIDNKCAEWKGTDMAKYLRPETLFGNKFESYLNSPVAVNNGVKDNSETWNGQKLGMFV